MKFVFVQSESCVVIRHSLMLRLNRLFAFNLFAAASGAAKLWIAKRSMNRLKTVLKYFNAHRVANSVLDTELNMVIFL